MLKVHPAIIIVAMMANAFLIYVFAAVAKLPQTATISWIMVGLGGTVASFGVFLGLVSSKVSVVSEDPTPTVTQNVVVVKPAPPSAA